MCLNPLTIRNPTKVVNIDGGQLLSMSVPCGHCAECVVAKRNEWFVRCHYEVKRTLSLGGYVYFDTLTYNNENLPKLSHFVDINKYGLADFSCFNLQHFKAFLKRLRRKIAYYCGVKSGAFRYFLTSEYGEDERFTHRPHYHILFFVYCGISPMTFSQYVSECWSYGRTDGYPYYPWNSYVANHVYGYDKNVDFKAVESVCLYVSKYITKSSKFTQVLKSRVFILRSKMQGVEDDAFISSLIRNIDMFHRQSQGFGLSFIDEITPDALLFLQDNKVIIKDSDKIVKSYSCPMYYLRKLYYTLEKRNDGTRYWQLTKHGINHNLSYKLRLVDKLSLSFMDIVRNCTNDELVVEFFELLDGRDISELAIYDLFYKGRHRHKSAVYYGLNKQLNTLTDEESNLHDWLLCHSVSLCPYLSTAESILQVEDTYVQPSALNNYCHNEHISTYVSRYVFDEYSCIEFRHFDRLGGILQLMTKYKRENIQITFDFLEDLKSKYKVIFNK